MRWSTPGKPRVGSPHRRNHPPLHPATYAGKCWQAHKACNIKDDGKAQCLPCNKAGRTCCSGSTCDKGLFCNASTDKCTAEDSGPPVPQAEYVVVQCDAATGAITMESTTPDADVPVVGNVFYNLASYPDSAEDVCSGCAQFGAVVTGVGAPGPCASGAEPCVAVQLETRPALLSEMTDAGFLEAASLGGVADKTALELLGCMGGNAAAGASRRLKSAHASPTPEPLFVCKHAPGCKSSVLQICM